MALIRRTPTSPTIQDPNSPAVPVPGSNTYRNATNAALASVYTRSSVITPEGIELPLTQTGSGYESYYTQTGQSVTAAQYSQGLAQQATYQTNIGRMPTYINRDLGFVRSTTGKYMSTKSLIPSPYANQAGNFQAPSFTAKEFAAIVKDPQALSAFNEGASTRSYTLRMDGIKGLHAHDKWVAAGQTARKNQATYQANRAKRGLKPNYPGY